MNFVPLTEMLYGLTDKFLDEDCKKQCYEQSARGDTGDLTDVTVDS